MKKPILCLDFDGVIHSYRSGWGGAASIPDPPNPGALEFMRAAVEHFDVHVFSSRSHQPGGINAMVNWLQDWASRNSADPTDSWWLSEIKWPQNKPPAHVSIDDRAITFTGSWPSIAMLKEFQPWNKTSNRQHTRIIPNVDAPRYMDLERRYLALLGLARLCAERMTFVDVDRQLVTRVLAHVGDAEARLPITWITNSYGERVPELIGAVDNRLTS